MDKPNMTIGDLLKRAGGVLNSSNVKGAVLIRRTIFYNKVSNENEYLNRLEELRARYVDSTNSGFTESAKRKLNQIDKEINELYVKKIKIFISDSLVTYKNFTCRVLKLQKVFFSQETALICYYIKFFSKRVRENFCGATIKSLVIFTI